MKGMYDYVFKGKTKVNSLYIKKIKIPDWSSYINYDGLSYKIISGYRFNESFKLKYGYEFIFHGKKHEEFNLGIFKKIKTNQIIFDLIIDKTNISKNSFSLEINRNLYPNINIGFIFDQYNIGNLYGLRNSPQIVNNDGYFTDKTSQFFTRISVKY